MTSIKLFWSLAVHRHQKQHSMSCSFGKSGCQKTMVKNENFHAKICQNSKFFDTWELYTSKESLKHVQYKFKKKKYDFFQKKIFFLIFSIFFQRGDSLVSKLLKNFFHFSKISKQNEKWLVWDHSNVNRNKVMNFGVHSPYPPVETARLYIVIRAIMAPPFSE